MVTTLDEMPGLLSVATASVAQLERPQKVVGFLEVRANCHNLVDQVLDADDPVLAEYLRPDRQTGHTCFGALLTRQTGQGGRALSGLGIRKQKCHVQDERKQTVYYQ